MSPREVYDSVDDAVQAVGLFSKVPLKAQANTMGMAEPRLRDAVDPLRSPRFPASWVAPQARAAQNFAVVRTICRDAGGIFIPLPKASGDNRDVVSALGEVLREVGEDAALIGSQLADGKLDPREASDAIAEIDQTAARLASLRQLLAERAEAKS